MTDPDLHHRVASLSGYGIAITRPTGQAKKLASLISAQGGISYFFPLIEIAPLADYSTFELQLKTLDQYDWAIFISSNAVQHAMPKVRAAWPKLPAHLHFAAIGPTTASELQAWGVDEVLTPQQRYDSESMLALPELQHMQGNKVVIFRGVGGRELLADTLVSRGAQVDFAESYRRINPQENADQLAALWQNKALHAIVVTSSEAMRHLLDITADGNAEWLRDSLICVNHARIAEAPQKRGLHVAIANAPGDDAMLQCLTQHLTL